MVNILFESGFYTRSFSEIFYPAEESKTSFDVFKEMFVDSGIPLRIKESTLETLFYLLYARHGSDHIKSIDENQFKYDLQSIIFNYGPAWEKRLEIQEELRALSLAEGSEIFKGGEAIYNTAKAPGTSTASLVDDQGKLNFLNGQNTTEYRKSKLEGYANLAALLETDVTEEFLNRFKRLFKVIPLSTVMPKYITNIYEEE